MTNDFPPDVEPVDMSTAAEVTTLTNVDAVPLASAMISRLAREHDIRALLIKGLVVEELGLREPRRHADVDVLVEPARFDDLVEALAAFGWHERIHYWMFDRLEEHSMTLIHPSWPIDIDLHRLYPGFLAPAADVFDELWPHRQEFTIAHSPVLGTDDVAGSAVLALHALRSMYSDRNQNEYAYLIDKLGERPSTVESITRLAAQTGSSETLAPFFEELRVQPVDGPPVDKRLVLAWRRRVSHPSRTGQWFTYFVHTPVTSWPREIRAVLWPPADLFLQDHPNVSRTAKGLRRARWARLLRGVTALRSVIRAGRSNGRSQSLR